jgi:hypothetical protein
MGDLWTQGTSGDLMRCQTARESGSYVASDWVKAVKYTDDTLANTASQQALAAQTSANNANTAVSSLNTYIDGAFSDGIVSEAEAVSIEKYINSLNTEKANVDASYNRLYANAYLTGTAKTNLATSKTAYNTTHANLITAINTAIADKKTTVAEKTDVNSKFALYKTALSDYSTAVENANKAIQDYLKSEFKAELDVQADRITANVTRIDAIGNRIENAGWITASQGNTLYATKSEYNSLGSLVATHTSQIEQNAQSIALKVSTSDYNGNTIASLINQTATTIKIQASKINLTGAITTSALASDVSNLINSKANASALSNYIPVGEVEQAMKDEGLIVGGYMKMSLINTNSIYANMASLGNFTISNGWLVANSNPGSDVGYIDMRGTSTRIAFGRNLIPSTAGGSLTCTAIIQNGNSADSVFGETIGLSIKAVGGKYYTGLQMDGGLRMTGRVSIVEEVELNGAISNSSGSTADVLKYKRTFVFQTNSYSSVYLPSDTAIASTFGYTANGIDASYQSVIEIRILVTKWASDRIMVTSTIPIIDSGGNTLKQNSAASNSNFNMGKGNCVVLWYHNHNWYVTSSNFM